MRKLSASGARRRSKPNCAPASHADERGWKYMYGAQLEDKTGPLAGVPHVGTNPLLASLYNHPDGPNDKPLESWKEEWLKRHVDLVDKYQPDLLYFDNGIPHGAYCMALIAHKLNTNAVAHGQKSLPRLSSRLACQEW